MAKKATIFRLKIHSPGGGAELVHHLGMELRVGGTPAQDTLAQVAQLRGEAVRQGGQLAADDLPIELLVGKEIKRSRSAYALNGKTILYVCAQMHKSTHIIKITVNIQVSFSWEQ